MATAQKFNKAMLIQALEVKIEREQQKFLAEQAGYPDKLAAWQKKATKIALDQIERGVEVGLGYQNRPPTKPALEVKGYKNAIAQLNMMAGDVVSFRTDDSVLRLAL